MRIVGGANRGRSLTAPRTRAVRPTADRTREAVFNILDHGQGVAWPGATVLDLFAGTGALALEALSRGAAAAVLVENLRASIALIEANIATLAVADQCRLLVADATCLGPRPAGIAPAAVAFLDPPYGQRLIEPALAALVKGDWLAPAALAVAEFGDHETITPPPGFAFEDQRSYGAAQIAFLRFTVS